MKITLQEIFSQYETIKWLDECTQGYTWLYLMSTQVYYMIHMYVPNMYASDLQDIRECTECVHKCVPGYA